MDAAEQEQAVEMPVKKGKSKVPLIILSIFLLLGAAGGFWWWRMANTYVSTENARITGDITNASFRMSGRVDQVMVQEGDTVHKGQVLALLDNAQNKTALLQAQAALDLARSNRNQLPYDLTNLSNTISKSKTTLDSNQAKVEKAELAVTDAERQLRKTEELFAAGAISQESVDQSRYRYQVSMADLSAARAELEGAKVSLTDSEQKLRAKQDAGKANLEAQVKSAEAALQAARLNYEYTHLNAPGDASILKIAVHPGETVAPGQQVMVLADLDATWVAANIEETKVSRIKPGQKVEVRIDAYPGKIFAGKVASVGDAAQSTFTFMPAENTGGNFTKVTQKVPVKIQLARYQEVFKPGMSAVVKIRTTR